MKTKCKEGARCRVSPLYFNNVIFPAIVAKSFIYVSLVILRQTWDLYFVKSGKHQTHRIDRKTVFSRRSHKKEKINKILEHLSPGNY